MRVWYLNGVLLGEFKGLSEEKINDLKLVAEVNGVKCFTSNSLPKGTLELYEGNTRVAVVDGLAE